MGPGRANPLNKSENNVWRIPMTPMADFKITNDQEERAPQAEGTLFHPRVCREHPLAERGDGQGLRLPQPRREEGGAGLGEDPVRRAEDAWHCPHIRRGGDAEGDRAAVPHGARKAEAEGRGGGRGTERQHRRKPAKEAPKEAAKPAPKEPAKEAGA